jgi:hypothetical protein
MGGVRGGRRARREGMQESLTIVAASVAAFAAGAAGTVVGRSDDRWESTAVVSERPPRKPLRSAEAARRALDEAGAYREEAAELLDRMSSSRSGGGKVAFTVRADEPDAATRLAGATRAGLDGGRVQRCRRPGRPRRPGTA